MTSSMLIGPPSFPVFNDHLPLNMDAVADGDLIEFVRSNNADMNFAASAAWSAGCEWYFVILPDTGIALFNVFDRRGILCKRPTGEFIGHCLKNGMLSRSLRSKRKPPSGGAANV